MDQNNSQLHTRGYQHAQLLLQQKQTAVLPLIEEVGILTMEEIEKMDKWMIENKKKLGNCSLGILEGELLHPALRAIWKLILLAPTYRSIKKYRESLEEFQNITSGD